MEGHDASHAPERKRSSKRLVVVFLIMLAVAVLAWVPSLFSRGPTYGGTAHTGSDFTLIFIPAWITLTVGVCFISLYFFKYLVDAEKARDSEPVTGRAPAHH
jgi:flagellar basal body-associated protein FliL